MAPKPLDEARVTEYAREIAARIDRATPAQYESALSWYADAREIAVTIADALGISVPAGAGILSALSPRCPWSRNVALALDYAHGREVRTLGANLRKCDAIVAHDRAGRDPLAVFGDSAPKTGAFARNIAGDLESVTVDVWALRAAGVTDRDTPTIVQYREIAEAYARVSRERGLSPAVGQALAWIVERGGAE